MYQPWLFGTMMAAGTGLVAATVTLQRPPAPEPVLVVPAETAVHILPPPLPTTVAEPQSSDAVLQMEPVVVEARHHRPAAAAPIAAPEAAPAERPCSSWRDLGPTHVVAGKPSGDLQVRDLCP